MNLYVSIFTRPRTSFHTRESRFSSYRCKYEIEYEIEELFRLVVYGVICKMLVKVSLTKILASIKVNIGIEDIARVFEENFLSSK